MARQKNEFEKRKEVIKLARQGRSPKQIRNKLAKEYGEGYTPSLYAILMWLYQTKMITIKRR